MIYIRTVKLVGGPEDGSSTMASHNTAVCNGHVYVWDGGEDTDRFVHAQTLMDSLPEPDRTRERQLMIDFANNTEEWFRHPKTEAHEFIKTIPPWRVNMWLELHRYGEIE